MSGHVLVVEDEDVVRTGIRRILNAAGFSVISVATGRAAIEHAALGQCRLVLCDLMLPDCPGHEVIASIKLLWPELPIVVITGYVTPEILDAAILAGAKAVLPKPFDEGELISLVERNIGTEPERAGTGPAIRKER